MVSVLLGSEKEQIKLGLCRYNDRLNKKPEFIALRVESVEKTNEEMEGKSARQVWEYIEYNVRQVSIKCSKMLVWTCHLPNKIT